jgi:predicted DCC family thiol-disulfide oxidoreductase YuxK
VNTVITDKSVETVTERQQLFYDRDCSFCVQLAERLGRALGQRRIELVPLQAPGAAKRLRISGPDLMSEMRLRTQDGRVWGGAEAAVRIARQFRWGRRWNLAFHELAHKFSYRPLQRRFGTKGATVLVFFISGLIHEWVISLPAGGGYGLPTGYFLLQGAGLSFERSKCGRRLGLGGGWRGWVFTILWACVPAFSLFHPPFIHRVILPFLAAIGAR